MKRFPRRRLRELHARRMLRSSKLNAENLEPRLLLATVGGVIATDTTWTLDQSPYEVTSDISVSDTATLRIEPGVQVRFSNNTGIGVSGRLVAEGTAFDRINFDVATGGSQWDGISFSNTLTDSRIAFADMHNGDGQGEAINVNHSRLMLDNIVWTGTTGTILELEHPSLIVRNSHFPTSNGAEIIHGEHIVDDEYLIIDGNVFENSNNGGDVIDILGADRPGPVMQILNNVFKGGGDDGLDLDGTDAHIEGNLFMNFHVNTGRATTSNAIATGLPQSGEDNRTQITVVRNIFVNNDHAILLKEDAFATIENNLFVGSLEAAIQFNEVGGTAVNGPGMGATLNGNIFYDNAALFQNLVDANGFKTQLEINNSLLPNDPINFGDTNVNPHSLGTGNIDADPQFVDAANGNYRLSAGSPAIGALPDGTDMGAYVLGGPRVTKVDVVSGPDEASFVVSGPGITHFRYRLNNEPYGPLTPVNDGISLSGLVSGDHEIDVIGMNSAGEWYTGESADFGQNTAQIISPTATRTGETFPLIVRVADWQGETNSLFTQPLNLSAAGSLNASGIRVKKGVGSAAPTVTATSDFAISITGAVSASETQSATVLAASFPTQTYGGTLTGNTVWDATADRLITSNLTIPAGSSLTIQPGTRVLLDGAVNITVAGGLTTNGMASNPIVFNATNASQPWGGLELVNTTGSIEYTFFTNGGADNSRMFGHSNSQPVIFVDGSTLDCDNCYVINNTGKALGSRRNAVVNIQDSVISDVDTGAQFDNSLVTVTNTWLKNIPNDSSEFSDDDNDGFYFSGVHSSGAPSRFQDSFIIETKDDGLDHNGARLEVIRAWIEGADHEGIASSNQRDVRVVDSVFIGNNQGVEAGYQDPDLFVTNSVMFNNRNDTDPNSPITAGVRFGDGYNGSNGSYTGHITATNLVVHDNGDNVRNFDGELGGPQTGAIDITNSLTNDEDYDADVGNQSGVPVFGPRMHLLRGSAGRDAGNDGLDMGRIIPATSRSFRIDATESVVRISEVLASTAGGFNFIELHNGGTTTLNLSGYRLNNSSTDPNGFTLPAGTMLAADDYLTLVAGNQSVDGFMPTGFSLDRRGGTVSLFLPAGNSNVVDSIEFNQQLVDRSMVRLTNGDWTIGVPTPDAANTPLATAPATAVKINEWFAAGAGSSDFVELYNSSGLPVNIGGVLFTNDPLELAIEPLGPFTFIPAEGLMTFYSTVLADPSTGVLEFDISANGGDIWLVDQGTTVDHITYGQQTPGVSEGRRPNGGDQIDFFDPPTPQQNNPAAIIVVPDIVSFQNGVSPDASYAGTQDVWIRGSDPNTNFGNDGRTDADGESNGSGEWTLLRWDVSSLNPATVVESATITLVVNNASTDDYQLYGMNTNWVESQATWNTPGGGSNWATPGTGAADRGSQIGVLASNGATGSFDIELNAAGIALIRSWIANPASNFGVIIYNAAATDGLEMRSSNYATSNQRPRLSIEIGSLGLPEVSSAVANLGSVPQSISVEFSEQVTVQVGDLRLRNTITGEFFIDFEFDYNQSTHTATWQVNSGGGVLPVGDYRASVSTEEVVDVDGNPLVANELTFARLFGDTNGSQTVGADDIGPLCSALGQPANSLFDLNADGSLTSADVDYMVRTVLSSEYGDADLNGVVNTVDYNIWAANRFTQPTGWSRGDFNCDDKTDVSDFNVWNDHRFEGAPPAQRAARAPQAPIGSSAEEVSSRVDAVFAAQDTLVNEREHGTTSPLIRRSIATVEWPLVETPNLHDRVLRQLARRRSTYATSQYRSEDHVVDTEDGREATAPGSRGRQQMENGSYNQV